MLLSKRKKINKPCLLYLHLYHHLKFTINREKVSNKKSTEKNKFKLSKKRIFEYKRKEKNEKRL